MSTNWHLFDPADVRIAAMGNEAFGAYVRALRWCESSDSLTIPESEALAIAPDHVWDLLASAMIVVRVGGVLVVHPLVAGPRPKKVRAPKVKCKIQNDFVLTPERRQMALAERLDPKRIDAIFAKFRDHWLSNGELKADWDATWRNWCRSPYQDQDRLAEPAPRQARPTYEPAPADLRKINGGDFLSRLIDNGEALSLLQRVKR